MMILHTGCVEPRGGTSPGMGFDQAVERMPASSPESVSPSVHGVRGCHQGAQSCSDSPSWAFKFKHRPFSSQPGGRRYLSGCQELEQVWLFAVPGSLQGGAEPHSRAATRRSPHIHLRRVVALPLQTPAGPRSPIYSECGPESFRNDDRRSRCKIPDERENAADGQPALAASQTRDRSSVTDNEPLRLGLTPGQCGLARGEDQAQLRSASIDDSGQWVHMALATETFSAADRDVSNVRWRSSCCSRVAATTPLQHCRYQSSIRVSHLRLASLILALGPVQHSPRVQIRNLRQTGGPLPSPLLRLFGRPYARTTATPFIRTLS